MCSKVLYGFAVIILIAFMVVGNGCDGENGSNSIETQSDADFVAASIYFQLRDAAPYYIEEDYSNTQVSGSAGGYVIVNGSVENYDNYPNSTYIYDNVTFQCEDYCTSEDYYPHLTGDASIDGAITAKTVGSEVYYSGSWTLSGSLTLSGAYEGSVSINLEIEETGSIYYGTLTVDGTTWYVQ